MEQLIAGLLIWIGQYTNFEYDPSMGMPAVEQVDQRTLATLYLDSDSTAQGYLSDANRKSLYAQTTETLEAVYAVEENKIYIGERIDPNTAYGRSVLVHELIHFLQYQHGDHHHVACSNKLETDAYLIQSNYMTQHQVEPPFNHLTIMMRSLCKSDLHPRQFH